MSSSVPASPVRIAMIVCAARNGTIGRTGDMPWRMPTDLKYFKATTLGKPLIMGRKTYQSIGKPLPGRITIVISRQPGLAIEGAIVTTDLDAALAEAGRQAARLGTAEIIIAGGGEIYRLALPQAHRVYLTRLDAAIDGDATFPDLDPADWQVVSDVPLIASPRDDHGGRFLVYERRS